MNNIFVATNTFAGFDFQQQLTASNAGTAHDADNGLSQSLGLQATVAFVRHTLDAPLQDSWFSYKIKGGSIASGYDTPLFDISADDGTPFVRLACSNGTGQFQRWNGSVWINVGNAIANMMPAVRRFDVHTFVDASAGSFELYMDGAIIAQFTGNTSTSGAGAVNFKINGSNPFTVVGHRAIIIADFDTRKIDDVRSALPNGAGFHTGWTGIFSDVDSIDADDVNGLNSDTAGEISSFTLTQPSVTGNTQISGVVVNARASRDAAGPQNINLGVRTGGADFFSPNIPVDEITGSVSASFTLNPDTGQPWTDAELASLEAVVRSQA